MTRARLRRGVRKRKEAREAKERKVRRVWAHSLPRPLTEAGEGPEPCIHTWGEPVAVSFSKADHAVIRVCETCRGFVRRCKRCRRFHLVNQGLGGEHSMPWWVSESWLNEQVCSRRDLGDEPVPFVLRSGFNGTPMFDLATYEEIDGEAREAHLLEWAG